MRGDRLKTLREQSNYTHSELASVLGLGYAQIYRYEAGKTDPSGEILSRIANVFNVSVDYLLGRTDNPTPDVDFLSDDERKAIVAWRSGHNYEAIKIIVGG